MQEVREELAKRLEIIYSSSQYENSFDWATQKANSVLVGTRDYFGKGCYSYEG